MVMDERIHCVNTFQIDTMDNIKKLLWPLILIAPLLSSAQGSDSLEKSRGIQWTTGLSWEQVKQKAIKENKYIFLDCFTTWCAPCKIMDVTTYTDESVGNYLNDHFISVRVQMDQTKKDDVLVKKWYKDAVAIHNEYHIDAYPTFVFLSPQGIIVEKDQGVKQPNAFVALAQNATQPGKVYYDAYGEYDQLVADYKRGTKHYDKMLGMMKVAEKKGDKELARNLLKDHTAHIAKLPKTKRYKKEEVLFWSKREIKSNDQIFQFFYKDGDLIDKVRNRKGFAASVVDNVIIHEIIYPFFKGQPSGAVMFQGPRVTMLDAYGQPIIEKAGKADTTEADWKKLESIVRKKFNNDWAIREVEEAKQLWYEKHNNWHAYAINYLKKLERRGYDPMINNCAYNLFMYITDTSLLNQIIPWVEKVIAKEPNFYILDTYANLLYKVGRTKDAIVWESKAVEMAGEHKAYYLNVIEKMKTGVPTWN
jgi:thioredoxin-related protein